MMIKTQHVALQTSNRRYSIAMIQLKIDIVSALDQWNIFKISSNRVAEFCKVKMDVKNKQLDFVSCNFGLKTYLWFNETRVARLFDFEITRFQKTQKMSYQIVLHSVQLLLLTVKLVMTIQNKNGHRTYSFTDQNCSGKMTITYCR